MPRNTREWAHRKLSMASDNLESSLKHLLEVKNTYEELHPEISGPIETVMEAVSMLQDTLREIGKAF